VIGEEPGEARVVVLGEEKMERPHLHRRCPGSLCLWPSLIQFSRKPGCWLKALKLKHRIDIQTRSTIQIT